MHVLILLLGKCFIRDIEFYYIFTIFEVAISFNFWHINMLTDIQISNILNSYKDFHWFLV